MHKSGEVVSLLNRITQDMEPAVAARLIRKQTMVVAIGAELGFSSEQLVGWRGSVLLDAQSHKDAQKSQTSIFQDWLSSVLPDDKEVRPVLVIAETWNAVWERKEADIIKAVREELSLSIEEKYLAAFECAAGKIHPIRP